MPPRNPPQVSILIAPGLKARKGLSAVTGIETAIIRDATGRAEEVSGEGVVGEQPVLEPGGSFEYTSGTPLPTPSGIMLGSYEMEDTLGGRFSVTIPAFSLDSPYQRINLN